MTSFKMMVRAFFLVTQHVAPLKRTLLKRLGLPVLVTIVLFGLYLYSLTGNRKRKMSRRHVR